MCWFNILKSRPSHSTTRQAIPSDTRNAVWQYYHSNAKTGQCYCCGTKINRYNGGWHCSHVIADAKGGSTRITNLRTCCPHCNLSMGDQNMYAYIYKRKLTGPGAKNVEAYFKKYPNQRSDKRTNNWNYKNNTKK